MRLAGAFAHARRTDWRVRRPIVRFSLRDAHAKNCRGEQSKRHHSCIGGGTLAFARRPGRLEGVASHRGDIAQ